MRQFIYLFIGLFLLNCAEQPRKNQPAGIPREPLSVKSANNDLQQLKSELGLERPNEELGFTDKMYDSCQSNSKNTDGKCGTRFLNVIHFRLLCRDSEGTIDSVAAGLTPVISDQVQWKIAAQSGNTKTDANGFGQILTTTATSASNQRLVLIVGKQFLGLELNQVSQIIVPNYWCNQQ